MSTTPPTSSAWGELPEPPPPLPPPPPGDAPASAAGPKGLPAVGWSIWEAVLIGLVTNLVVAQTVVGVIAFLALGVTTSDDPKTIYVGLIVDLAWFGGMIGWLMLRHPRWREQLGVHLDREGLRNGGYGFVAGLILYPVIAFVVGLPLTILFSALSGEDATTPDQLPPHLTGAAVVASVILAVLIAPVVEETYFRGILFRSVRDVRGPGVGIAVSAALFGLVHYAPAEGAGELVLPLVMVLTGAVLAVLYERSGNLVVPIAAHMAFNAIGVTLILSGWG